MNAIALLLAAGESQRMGSPKALLPWRGRPLLSHQARQIEASRVSECVVVLGREAERLLPHLSTPRFSLAKTRTVINPHAESGKCSSVIAGLSSLPERPDAIFVVSVDQPVEHRLLNALLDAAAAEWEVGSAAARRTIVLPAHAGRRGHPPLFHGCLMAELMGIVEESHGLKAVVRRRPERVLDLPWESADVLLNLNRPDDLPLPPPGSDRTRPRL
jgi:molybdenum cofactor cytidylyltransferase